MLVGAGGWSGGESGMQFFQRLGAVAQFVFHVFAKLGKGQVKTIGHKQRIVAKTILSARRENNPPFARAIKRRQVGFDRVTNW